MITRSEINLLAQYVIDHTTRGECECGRCVVRNGTYEKPTDHVLDLSFFKVGMKNSPDASTFTKLAMPFMPAPEKETSYVELGALLGDQQVALLTMALGHLLGIWECLTPANVLGDKVDHATQLKAAESGLITIRLLV